MARRVKVLSFIFKNSLTPLLVVAVMGFAFLGFAAGAEPLPEVWVDQDGSNAARLNIKNYYTTFAAALSAVSVGGTVKVLPGVYYESPVIRKSVKFLAVDANGQEVNPMADPNNTHWPVIIDGSQDIHGNASGIKASGKKADNIIIRGFFVRNISAHGIQVWGHQTYDENMKHYINDHYCSNVEIAGNKVDSVQVDGIKVHQCTDVNVHGNIVSNFSQGPKEKQGIDFVAVANSQVVNNIVLQGSIGMDLKAGSTNILVEHNEFLGPFKWTAFAAEPSSEDQVLWHAHHNEHNYQLRNVVMRDNWFYSPNKKGDVYVSGCQNCSFNSNHLAHGILLKASYPMKNGIKSEESSNICLMDNHEALPGMKAGEQDAGVTNLTDIKLSSGSCADSLSAYPRAEQKSSPVGLDMYAS